MRRIVIRLIRWACKRWSISPIDETRIMNGADAVERGARWETFYREQGGLADMLMALRAEAFEVAAELDPKDTDKIYYWAMADRNIRRLQARIEGVIVTGKAESERRQFIEREQSARVLRSI